MEFFDNIDKINEKTDRLEKECFKDFIKIKDKGKKDYYKKYMIFEKSLDIFEECLTQISKGFPNKKGKMEKISNLNKLYSIAFIKVYLNKFVEFEFSQKYNDMEIKDIFDRIKTSVHKNTNLENVIKIYIIKILYNLNNRNFEKILEYDLIQCSEFKNIQINSQHFLINYFVPLDENDEKEFKHGIEKFYEITENEKKSKEGVKENKNEISIYSNENDINNIDLFLSITINYIISNLLLKDYLKENTEELENYKKIGKFLNECLSSQSINPNLLKVLNLFYDKKQFMWILKKKFDEQYKYKIFVGEPYESLLYGLKFSAQSLLIYILLIIEN